MSRTEHIDHPAVEIELPVDRDRHQVEIPRDTTLFFWGTVAAGTSDRIPQIRSPRGSRLFATAVEAQDRISWSISIDGESVPLLSDSYYREGEYAGLARWIAVEPIELPASVSVRFETSGERPTDRGDPVVLWTEQGTRIPWGTTLESAIELVPSRSLPKEFPTRTEQLWEQHTVYVPR